MTRFLLIISLLLSTSTQADTLQEPWSALSLTPALRALLADGNFGSTPKGFRIVALSFLADGCVAEAKHDASKRDAGRACVKRAFELALKTRAQPMLLEHGDGLWLSHFNLILGAGDAVGPCLDASHHRALSAALKQRTLDDAFHHVPSYARLPHRWPADQAATLAGLARYDSAHGTQWSAAPTRAWRDYMLERAIDKNLALPWSEVTGVDKTSKLPRGCALSMQTRFLSEVDDALARTWWREYRRQFWVEHAGLGGLREWPEGVERGSDIDSGPIVLGIGAAATGLGIAAARVMEDEPSAVAMERTAQVMSGLAKVIPAANGPLPEAIRYLGVHIRPPTGAIPKLPH